MNSAASALIAALSTKTKLPDGDQDALASLPIEELEIRRGQDIIREGDRPTRSMILLAGLTCSYKTLPNGNRQITAFHVPGDIPDIQSLHLDVQDNSILSMSDCRVGFMRHRDVSELCFSRPPIAMGFWRVTLVDTAIYREWTTNVGQRPAVARMAHLFCEVLTRLMHLGLTKDYSCALPVTQVDLADALGLSVVHVNRTLMELRKSGSLRFERGELTALNWPLLARQAQFDPSYLHLQMDDHAPYKLV